MYRNWKKCAGFAAAIFVLLGAGTRAMAEEDAPWRIGKSSGEVWITAPGVQQASLAPETQLRSGDTIRTGATGRVLLTRGEETILVSPNSVVGIPSQSKPGLSTRILQQAGSILLEVEKRNVKHFEVETPYLAAVVKGTQFRVSVNATGTSVSVLRGQVEVADFKSGQIAQVLAGQAATTLTRGKSGLVLSGSGALQPIEHGQPRAPSIERIMVPKAGLAAPRPTATGQQIHAVNHLAVGTRLGADRAATGRTAAHNPLHISSSLGEVHLNIHRVTNGLAHAAATPTNRSGRNDAVKDTIWSSNETKASTGFGTSSDQGNAIGRGNTAAGSTSIAGSASAGSTSAASAVAASASSSSTSSGSTGNGRGNSGNGNGNGNGGGNGKGNGNGNDNDNGNSNGNGNGNGNGHGKK